MSDVTTLAAEIVAAAAANEASRMRPEELVDLIKSVRAALSEDASAAVVPEESSSAKPTKLQIKKSVTPDALISFLDGKRYKALKRSIGLAGLTPAGYRERFGLPADYPMTAPNYSAMRSAMAKKIGLGSKAAASSAPKAKPTKSRKAKAG